MLDSAASSATNPVTNEFTHSEIVDEMNMPDVETIDEFLAENEHKELLKFLTCGSVDDGKSTLLGRLLYDTNKVYEDHMSALIRDSGKYGRTDEELDFALLADGLRAEQEQGITIDVAYRYFTTASRKFIIADCPGHAQYTKNMATGASNCELAVILIDAQNGVLDQTLRHSSIVSLLGIKKVIVAINKLDLVGYDEGIFNQIREDYLDFVSNLDFERIDFVPVAAKFGENIVNQSEYMMWYQGETILELLESVPLASPQDYKQFCMTVQRVHRPREDFRGYSGTINRGTITPGEPVRILPSGLESTVERIVTMDGDLDEAFPSQSVTITLSDELSISRGDLLVAPSYQPHIQNRFKANIVWMGAKPLSIGKKYVIKSGARQITGKIDEIDYRLNVTSQQHESCDTLAMNEIGQVVVDLQGDLVFESYEDDSHLGSFIVIDRLTNETVAAGMITEAS